MSLIVIFKIVNVDGGNEKNLGTDQFPYLHIFVVALPWVLIVLEADLVDPLNQALHGCVSEEKKNYGNGSQINK